MRKELKLTINGEPYELTVKPNTLLADLLSNELRLTGVRRGCDSGSCGACTIILDGKAVKSCSTLAIQANGKEITTIEGLAHGDKLHPIQQAFVDHFAIQCGFCTPGMIMSAKALLDAKPDPTEDEVKQALRGNLCRCTGYVKIIEAILAAKDEMKVIPQK
ncbi:(2Fe-2S)-binding protein [Chloroflexota bacterium]